MADSTVEFESARICRETDVQSVELHHQLPSTNDRALELASFAPASDLPLLVLAIQQTGGRGRGDHRWWAGEGALTFSVILDTNALQLLPRKWPRVSLVTGISVANTVRGQLQPPQNSAEQPSVAQPGLVQPGLAQSGLAQPNYDVRVKWPNDVFVRGRKICGILTENAPRQTHRLVIGIGLNVNNSWHRAPPELQHIGTSMSDVAQQSFSAQEVLIDLLQRLQKSLVELAHDAFPLTEAWRVHCMLEGHTVTVELAGKQIAGVCQGIDEDGALLLQNAGGIERCVAGTVIKIQ